MTTWRPCSRRRASTSARSGNDSGGDLLTENDMARVDIKYEGSVAGVWASCEKGTVGIVACDNAGAYLAIYRDTDPKKPGTQFPDLPVIAVTADGLQVAPGGKDVKIISLEKLMAML